MSARDAGRYEDILLERNMRRLNKIVVAGLVLLSFHAFSQGYGEERRFTSCDLGVSFDYPSTWGNVIITDHRDDASKAYLMDAAGLDWVLKFESLHGAAVEVVLRIGTVSDSCHNREIVYEGSTRSYDLFELRNEIARKIQATVAGCAAGVQSLYFEPGEKAQRITTWFCSDRIFELTEEARVPAFPMQRHIPGKELGLSCLMEQNPNDARLLEHSLGIDLMLKSMSCER